MAKLLNRVEFTIVYFDSEIFFIQGFNLSFYYNLQIYKIEFVALEVFRFKFSFGLILQLSGLYILKETCI